MRDTILICAVAAIFILGYFLMDKVDKFVDSNQKHISASSDEPAFHILPEDPADTESTMRLNLSEDRNARVENRVESKIKM